MNIEKGQHYFYIDCDFTLGRFSYSGCRFDETLLECGNMFPYTSENKEEVKKEVEIIAAKRKLQSELEQFARQNNEGEIDWNSNDPLKKWYIYADAVVGIYGVGIYGIYRARSINTIYFTSKEVAEQARRKFDDRIRELYLKEGEE